MRLSERCRRKRRRGQRLFPAQRQGCGAESAEHERHDLSDQNRRERVRQQNGDEEHDQAQPREPPQQEQRNGERDEKDREPQRGGNSVAKDAEEREGREYEGR